MQEVKAIDNKIVSLGNVTADKGNGGVLLDVTTTVVNLYKRRTKSDYLYGITNTVVEISISKDAEPIATMPQNEAVDYIKKHWSNTYEYSAVKGYYPDQYKVETHDAVTERPAYHTMEEVFNEFGIPENSIVEEVPPYNSKGKGKKSGFTK
ncbi:hypothetical protein [Paenibacillus agricola]|uniref:Uncharacterized protein n=1 Tax=Paenibacillus agricola TaxID=2716264 RepID=A0ABX0J4V2_9BACL|nr:hypothetical protein [Paenibacillus agricola]NHN30451.1 hypothetical protein [Paenibacillus agricola]